MSYLAYYIMIVISWNKGVNFSIIFSALKNQILLTVEIPTKTQP